MDDRRELSSGHRSLSGYTYLFGAASLPTGSKGWHRGTEGASQYVNGRNGGIKENFRRERWIEVDMAWHEHIYEMSANPFLTSFASLFHSVYHTYFTSITSDTVIKLDLHQAIVDAIIQSDGDAAFKACQALLRSPDK